MRLRAQEGKSRSADGEPETANSYFAHSAKIPFQSVDIVRGQRDKTFIINSGKNSVTNYRVTIWAVEDRCNLVYTVFPTIPQLSLIIDDEDKELIDKGVNIAVLMATVTIDPEIVPETDKQAIDDLMKEIKAGLSSLRE